MSGRFTRTDVLPSGQSTPSAMCAQCACSSGDSPSQSCPHVLPNKLPTLPVLVPPLEAAAVLRNTSRSSDNIPKKGQRDFSSSGQAATDSSCQGSSWDSGQGSAKNTATAAFGSAIARANCRNNCTADPPTGQRSRSS
eukprot:CAMPEP_0172772558 /NCGR_PEP_ID=MMETSP1074-20121228/192606_1 /TAXON_ID=2916 /ORGANISM="Ceratium fusus, Strain PA161109" /LENGTH=137 /DNA_ID=CAMNT_0013608691 /DNA_START=163 /DNA_END=576 /DNA_ORIENTATION=-